MRLSKIRLAGFKSFVDPATLAMPGNLVGVVGPNGCGKSNVIDAVRWVMGESSAKHLRGDSMADVIFNGSTARKPVGQAAIELVFDNSDGSVAGQFAQYNEISVKRQVSRDGQSVYNLNGSRCRRRDITDLFLGTGLGPRSYAIIEQGTISRIIEARPEELRGFIEEAAGVSKYKERRRETESRIRHTRENLSRLSDLREELDKQLQRLQRQARTAERYKSLRQEERVLKAQALALRLRDLNGEAETQDRRITERETAYQAGMAAQRQVEASLERERESQVAVGDTFNQVQGRFYAVGADVARIEQTIAYHRERQEQLRRELARMESAWAEASGHLSEDESRLAGLHETLERDEPELEVLRAAETRAREVFSAAEGSVAEWQGHWDQFNQRASEQARAAEVERTRIQNLEQRLEQLRQRRARLETERDGLDPGELEVSLVTLKADLDRLGGGHRMLEASLEDCRVRIDGLRDAGRTLAGELSHAREAVHTRKGRLASLEALQQQALGRRDASVMTWLREHALADNPRLAQGLEVERGWERAAEVVLNQHLEAVCVTGAVVESGFQGPGKGTLELFDTEAALSPEPGDGGTDHLADKVRAPWPVRHLLAGVRVAEDLDEALAMRASLTAWETVVTREGDWLGGNWLRVTREADARAGVLAREQEMRDLSEFLDHDEARVAELQARQEQGRGELKVQETEQDRLRREIDASQRRAAELTAELGARQARAEQTRGRIARLEGEMQELTVQAERDESDLAESRGRLEENLLRIQVLEAERVGLQERRDGLRTALDEGRQTWHRVREATQALALRVEGVRSRRESLVQGLDRIREQSRGLSRRLEETREALAGSEAPLLGAKAELDARLVLRQETEVELTAARQRVEEVDANLRHLEKDRHRVEEQVQESRGTLEQARLDRQSTQVRIQTVGEQLAEFDLDVDDLLDGLPVEATEPAWREKVAQMEQRIARLGPINLAAIDEFEQQSERKAYLDAQNEDLNEALETLENAIHKIDRETRTRFRETFERINAGIKDMFPRLFGGGHAYLELTSDDLLDTGVTVMARPPGKRNSTIHLLSGGEKALTAVALVFAIFDLNPAPFCLLDEVDAPLDDANVGRFCRLVQSMSDRVQFMFITHNKTTMEMASHLIGVTMHEPGVSRLVAVDVEEAVEMATA